MKLPILGVAVFLLFAISPYLPAADPSQPDEIAIGSSTTWTLRIKPDGSGQITVGAADFGEFPKGTFSFADVYGRLQSIAKAEPRAFSI